MRNTWEVLKCGAGEGWRKKQLDYSSEKLKSIMQS